VYSFGIVLWELMARSLPYEHYENIGNQFAILKAVNDGKSMKLTILTKFIIMTF